MFKSLRLLEFYVFVWYINCILNLESKGEEVCFGEKDIRLLKEMSKAISYYLKAASYLSDETFNELSKYKRSLLD